jgi:glycogen debranching enzyme
MAQQVGRLDSRRCANWEEGGRLEWLVTNGRGGFAMATVNQMLTRRYHGLLVAAVDPPVERFVLLAKLDATATVAGRTYELATNSYVGAVHPHGYRFLDSFTIHPYPTWHWRAGNVVIEQTLCMVEGEETTFVRYRVVEGKGPVTLTVRPLCSSRHFHTLAQSAEMATPAVEATADQIKLTWPNHRPSWQMSCNGAFDARPDWYYQFFLVVEAQRGYDFKQDLFTPGTITATLQHGDPTGLVVAASTQSRSWKDAGWAFARAGAKAAPAPGEAAETPTRGGADRRPAKIHQHIDADTGGDPLREALTVAGRQFLVARGENLKTVIAGYPWFGDWGRDTFISLPGLCLVPGRYDDARRIIQAFAKHVDQGMIPNRFPDFGDAPEYNTADATLWYIHAIDRYLAYTGDWAFVAEEMFPIIADIMEAHEHGTRHGIRVGQDGLLTAGEPGYAVTWMDVQLPGRAITPRIGKPVEINALWYNALRIAAAYAERLKRTEFAARWRDIATWTRSSFNSRFPNDATGCLNDVVDVDGRVGAVDGSIRPNQLLAVSLTHSALDRKWYHAVVSTCHRHLWTPMGLRTLAPTDPAYKGRYDGDLAARDAAYHQGTVWPWLLGPFVTAYVKAFGDTPETRQAARKFLDGLFAHLNEAGLGGVSEVADGDAPHRPEGCPYQAWSVAEPLRALCEDILKTHPHAASTARELQSTAR